MSLKVSGQIKEAQLENLAADPANLPHGRAWYDNVLHKIKVSLNGVAKILVSEDGTHTLTNKTIVAADNTVTTAATGNLAATELNAALAELQGDIDTKGSDLTTHAADTSTHGVGEIVGRTEGQTIQNKSFDNTNYSETKDDSFFLQNSTDATKRARFQLSGITAGQTRTFTVPDATTALVGEDTTQNITNKTLDNTNTIWSSDTKFTLQDESDSTKQARFQLSGISAGQLRTYTLPDTSATMAHIGAQGQTFAGSIAVTGTTTLNGATAVNNNALQINAGILFPAAQNASANANTLDDYEEGTFTPTYFGASSAGVTTYTTQLGKYTKIGNVVYFTMRVTWTNATGTGAMRFGGLPFTADGTYAAMAAFSYFDSISITASSIAVAYVIPGQTSGAIYCYAAGGGGATSPSVDTAGDFALGGFYFI